ncbi:MAG: tetratricopeptide repeat protein [Chitinophagales bacterium]
MGASKRARGKKVAAEKNSASKTAAIGKTEKSRPLVFIAVIVLACMILYGPSLKNTWTNWDDEGYVLKNDLVTGFNLSGIFSEQVMGNYHPVTVLFQAIEYSFFKEDATGFHTLSLLLHVINALLLFFFIRQLTRKNIPAFIGALLFAIHPLHVESVSWVSAQKDLLYSFFYFAALIYYLQYKQSEPKGQLKYLMVFILFLLSLLSKAQAVTFPVVMILIDWYRREKFTTRVLLEKLPFFILAVIFGVVAIYAQQASDSIQDITLYSFPERLMFSAYAIVGYLTRLVVPLNLSAYYPYPEVNDNAFSWLVYTAPVIVGLIGFLLYRFRKKSAYLTFGMLFFLVNIFLVLQLLPVGGAITADRYTYLSFAGLFFVIAMFASEVWEQNNMALKAFRMPLVIAGSAWILFLSYQCQARAKVWYSSETLWTDVIEKYPRVPIAYNDLGSFYQKKEQLDLAKRNFDIALRLQPDFPQALINRCDLFRVINKIDSAIIDGNHAVALKPGDPDSHMNRGIAFSMAEKNDSALMDFRMVIREQPKNAKAYNNLGNLYMIKEQPDSAITNYNLALRYDPQFIDVLNNRGVAYLKAGNNRQAVTDLTAAIANKPALANNYYFRMQAFENLKRYKEALSDAQQAQKLGIQIPEDYLQQLMAGEGSNP